MYATGLHLLSSHLMDSTSSVVKLEASASTLNSLSMSGATNKGLLVKTYLSCSNASCCSLPHLHFSSFLVKLFNGQAILAKSFTNHL